MKLAILLPPSRAKSNNAKEPIHEGTPKRFAHVSYLLAGIVFEDGVARQGAANAIACHTFARKAGFDGSLGRSARSHPLRNHGCRPRPCAQTNRSHPLSTQQSALGCNYEAPTFGAGYPDGTCHDGYMWDLDSCDEPGGPLLDGGDTPCPWCNTREHIEYMDRRFTGNAHQRRIAVRSLTRKLRTWAENRSSFNPATGARS